MLNPLISIVDFLDSGKEAEAIRQSLEYFGFQTILYPIGRPNDFINFINGRNRYATSSFFVVCAHGNSGRILMPVLDSSVYLVDEPQHPFGPLDIIKFANFRRENLLFTGCTLGNPEFSKAILQKGAANYIAPVDYIDGNSVLAFTIRFFYELKKGQSISKSFAVSHQIDDQTQQFQLWNDKISIHRPS